MYAAIRRGKVKLGSAEEIARRVQKEAMPIVSSIRFSGLRCSLW